jgi:hypothetical protein
MAKKQASEAETPQYYQALHTGVGPKRQGDVFTASELGPNAQIDRLLRKGAIAEVDPPAHIVGKPSVRSAFVNSAGHVDQAGLDRPDIAARNDVQVLSPEERAEVVEQAEADAPEEVAEVPEDAEPVEEGESAPAAVARKKRK